MYNFKVNIMKELFSILLIFICKAVSCTTEDDCRRCTGIVTNTGDEADWTVCNNDGEVVRVNNNTGEAETSTNTLPEAVAFFESIGLDCE